MIDFLDQMQNQLISYIDEPKQNSVGHFANTVFNFAGGGLSSDENPYTTSSADNNLNNSDISFVQRMANATTKAINADNPMKGYGSSPLGYGFYNSPAYLAARFTDLGRFFTQSEPGNFYTNRYKQPEPGQPVKSEDPVAFYSRWYERMRNFAQAEEVATRGQPQIRGT